jgi:hypothetical protein
MATATIFVAIEGRPGGAFPLTILNEDVTRMFGWLLERVQASPLPGMANRERIVEYFRTSDGTIIEWADVILPYLEGNSRENPIVAVVRDAAPVAQAIPIRFQENVEVLAEAIRSRHNFTTSTGSNSAAAAAAVAHKMGDGV